MPIKLVPRKKGVPGPPLRPRRRPIPTPPRKKGIPRPPLRPRQRPPRPRSPNPGIKIRKGRAKTHSNRKK